MVDSEGTQQVVAVETPAAAVEAREVVDTQLAVAGK